MEMVHYDRFDVHRCATCKGLWFGANARERLEAVEGSEAIDTGEPHQEDRQQVVRINCPVCHTRMIRMVDHERPHIWYESCPVCFGEYFDAGEFRDRKLHKLGGMIRDIFYRHERV